MERLRRRLTRPTVSARRPSRVGAGLTALFRHRENLSLTRVARRTDVTFSLVLRKDFAPRGKAPADALRLFLFNVCETLIHHLAFDVQNRCAVRYRNSP